MVVNKGDLVTADQKADIIDKIKLLNPRAKVVESVHSKVDVMEILNTGLFRAEDNKNEFWMEATKVEEEKVEAVLECCETSMAKDGKKCCKSKSKDGKLVDSGMSQVVFINCRPISDRFTLRFSWMLLQTRSARSPDMKLALTSLPSSTEPGDLSTQGAWQISSWNPSS